MNQKITTIVLVLLMAGVAAVAYFNGKKVGEEAAGEKVAEEAGSAGAGSAGAESKGDGADGETGKKSLDRSKREIADAELVARYGEARTAVSRKVAGTMVSLLDDAVAMGELMTQGGGQAFGGRRGMMRGVLGRAGVELDEDQQEQAMALYEDYQKREQEKTKSAVENLRKDSTALMELFLAGDAKERGEMDESEYALVQADIAGRMPDVINPLDRNNFRGGQPMKDEALVSDFKEILNEDQGATFDDFLSEEEAKAAENTAPDGNISNIPTMELDAMDGAVTSAKKMTSGFRSVLEGMGGLQDLRPKVEPEAGE
jgi:hypothetical protein